MCVYVYKNIFFTLYVHFPSGFILTVIQLNKDSLVTHHEQGTPPQHWPLKMKEGWALTLGFYASERRKIVQLIHTHLGKGLALLLLTGPEWRAQKGNTSSRAAAQQRFLTTNG